MHLRICYIRCIRKHVPYSSGLRNHVESEYEIACRYPDVRFAHNMERIGINCDFKTNEIIGPDSRYFGSIGEDSFALPCIKNFKVINGAEEAKCFISKEV